jgi:hypothetical protein
MHGPDNTEGTHVKGKSLIEPIGNTPMVAIASINPNTKVAILATPPTGRDASHGH